MLKQHPRTKDYLSFVRFQIKKRRQSLVKNILALNVLVVCISGAASASEKFEPHFAFSSYFGSGLYNTTGRDVTIFNIPLVFDPDWNDSAAMDQVRLRIPISIGLSDFDYEHIQETDVQNDTATASVAIGLEKDVWQSDQLKLVPFVDIGFAEDLSNQSGALFYAFGSSLFQYFELWERQQIGFAKIQHAGFSHTSVGFAQHFDSLQIGADFRLPYNFFENDYASYLSFYAASYFYMVDLDISRHHVSAVNHSLSHELGFTWGLDTPVDMSLTDLERIGLGYRFSAKHNGYVHISFNFPLD